MPNLNTSFSAARRRLTCLAITLFTAALLAAQPALADDAALAALKAQIERVSLPAHGDVGVAVEHVQSGHKFAVKASESYPLASSYKVPTAVYLMHLVEQGKFTLDQMITVEPRQMSPGGMPIAHYFPHPGVALSLKNLLEVMLTESSNTATDVILELVGGGAKVTQFLRDNGIQDMRVDRTTADLIRNFVGWPIPADKNISLRDQQNAETAKRGAEGVDAEFDEPARYKAFIADPRDQATPLAMAQLLGKIWRDEILSPASTQLIREIMARCQTGKERLKGRLPTGTVVAHKTGTIGQTLNDVGVIYLPGGAGEVIVTVFTKNSPLPWPARELAIAEVARTVYDFYIAHPELTKK